GVAEKGLPLRPELVPTAARVAVLLNPATPTNASSTRTDVESAAATLGLQVQIYNASTNQEIDAAFAVLVRGRPDALFVGPDGFFDSRRVQLTALAARHVLPPSYPAREMVQAAGLLSS